MCKIQIHMFIMSKETKTNKAPMIHEKHKGSYVKIFTSDVNTESPLFDF